MKRKKIFKKLGWSLSVLALGLVLALVLIPFVYKDEIIEEIRRTINSSLTAEINWEDVDVSMLSSFPALELKIQKPTVVDKEYFEGDTLLKAEWINLSISIPSIIKKEESIQVIQLDFISPDLNLLVLNNGEENYQIFEPKDTSISEELSLFGQLKEYSISEGNITYKNESNDVELNLYNLNHSGSGDFSLNDFQLKTSSTAESFSLFSNSIPYLKNVSLDLESDFDINIQNSILSFVDSKLLINQLPLKGSGNVDYATTSSIFMDISFATEGNEFKNFLSVIPNAFTKSFESVKTDGIAKVIAEIEGKYNGNKELYPTFSIAIDASNASVSYPGKKAKIDKLFGHIDINNKTSKLENTLFDISSLSFEIEGQKVEGAFKIGQVLNDPRLKGAFKSKINLESIFNAFPFDEIEKLEGNLDADLSFDAKYSDIKTKNYKQISSTGKVELIGLIMKTQNLPEIKNDSSFINLNPINLDFNTNKIYINNSDIAIVGSISDPLGLLIDGIIPRAKLKLNSGLLDYDNLNNSSVTQDGVSSDGLAFNTLLDSIKLNYGIDINELIYDKKSIKKIASSGTMSEGNIDIRSFEADYNRKPIRFEGQLNNLPGYLYANEVLKGTIDLEASEINTDEWLTNIESDSSENITYLVPANIAVNINADIGVLTYDGITFERFDGSIGIFNQKAELKNVKANALGGSINLDGFYDTSDAGNPKFAISYDIKNLGFQETFARIKTFQLMAPIVKYLDGYFNSKFVISGELNANRLPVISSLTAVGYVETKEGNLKGWKPADALSKKLNVDLLKSLTIKNTINFFELVDGTIKFEDLKLEHSGIELVVSGGHSFNEQLGYYISASIPKELIKKSNVGSTVLSGMDFINNQASQIGLNIPEGDQVFLDITLKGTAANPIFQIKPKLSKEGNPKIKEQIEDKAKDKVEDIKDEVKEKIEDTKENIEDTIKSVIDDKTSTIKDSISNKVGDIKDTVKVIVDKKKDDIITKGKDILNEGTKEKLDSIFGNSKTDSLGTQIEKTLEDIFKKKKSEESKDSLKQKSILDLLKKKKKGNG
jgi:hypothetical protein